MDVRVHVHVRRMPARVGERTKKGNMEDSICRSIRSHQACTHAPLRRILALSDCLSFFKIILSRVSLLLHLPLVL